MMSLSAILEKYGENLFECSACGKRYYLIDLVISFPSSEKRFEFKCPEDRKVLAQMEDFPDEDV